MNKVRTFGIYSIISVVAFSAAPSHGSQPRIPERCDTWAQVLSKDNPGYIVWSIEEGCSGFSNDDTVALALSQATDTTRRIFFKFDDASWNVTFHGKTDPSVKWISRNRLEVSIGAVGAVLQKLDKVGNIMITYHIGHVLYK